MAYKVLSEFEHIQLCPGNYIGSTDNPTHLLYELIDNAADECLTGQSDFLTVIMDYDNNKYSVVDKGRGIPIKTKNFEEDVPIVISTKLFSGGKFDNELYQHRSGLHGEGLVIVNALSNQFEIITKNNNNYVQYIFNGLDVTKKDIENKKYSTAVSFIPNEKYFDTVHIDENIIYDRLKSILVYDLNNKIEMLLIIIKNEQINTIKIENSIVDDYKKECNDFVEMEIVNKKDTLQLFIGYVDDNRKLNKFKGIVNTLNVDSGTHQKMIEYIIKDYLYDKAIKNKLHVNKEDVLIGGRVLAIMRVTNPAFSGQTKYALNMRESQIEHIINTTKIVKLLDDNPEFVQKWLSLAQAYRLEIDSKRITKTRKNRNIVLVEDLKDCTSNNIDERELFLLEGQSAGGTLQLARDINIHALLPLRGKVLNVLNADKAKILNNKTLMNIFTAINVKPFSTDLSGLRYGKVNIMCFTGDTKVKMLNGEDKTFEELVEMEKENPGRDYWVYSMDDAGNCVPGRAYSPRITSYVNELIYITINNQHIIKCTLTHKFILKDNLQIEAKDLKPEMTLMPLCVNIYDINDYKITNIEYKKLNISIPVYNITVDKYHNYAVVYDVEKNNIINQNAIIVKNCDGDVDGKHIAALLISMFAYCLPQLIEEGNLYVVETPLFGYYQKKQFIPVYDEHDLEEIRKTNTQIYRYKGLGEMEPNELAVCALDPLYRKLIQVTRVEGQLTVRDVWDDRSSLISEYFGAD